MFVTGQTAPVSEEDIGVFDSSRTKPRVENPPIHEEKEASLVDPVFCVGIVPRYQPAQDVVREPKAGEVISMENKEN